MEAISRYARRKTLVFIEKGRKMRKIEANNSFKSMTNLIEGPQVKFDHRFGFPKENRCKNITNLDIFELREISTIDAQSKDEEFVDYF